MRRATCVSVTAPIVVLGTRASLTITAGWEGDLDQIVGERAAERDADGAVIAPAKTETLADHLGPHLLQHFEILAPAVASGDTRRGRRSPSPAPPTPETEE